MTTWLLLIILADSPPERIVQPMKSHAECVAKIAEYRKGPIPGDTQLACDKLDPRGAWMRELRK